MSNYEGEIRIYVACLASYNNGILHGEWIDARQPGEAIRARISKMLAASPITGAEEYAIHDHEGFEGLCLSEYADLTFISELADFLFEHGAMGAKLLENYGEELDDARRAIEDHYCGCFSSVAEFAEDLTDQTTSIPENLRFYIDYALMARDLEINDVLAIETGFEEVHIFWRH